MSCGHWISEDDDDGSGVCCRCYVEQWQRQNAANEEAAIRADERAKVEAEYAAEWAHWQSVVAIFRHERDASRYDCDRLTDERRKRESETAAKYARAMAALREVADADYGPDGTRLDQTTLDRVDALLREFDAETKEKP